MPEDDEDVYTGEGREGLVESDAITPEEEGFMEGAEGGGQGAKCRRCGEILNDEFVEMKVDGEFYRFCSDECAEKFKARLEEE